MKKKKSVPEIHIGTSGWSYYHWKDNFYPPELKSKDWLEFYSKTFSTVEINTTFYHLPLKSTISNWKKKVNEKFLFSIKASRYITHQKKLHDCKDSVELFLKTIQDLDLKLGPILFQLPPSFQINKERLEEFIGYLVSDQKYVFEFRHPTWYVDEIYELLSKNNIALCITDLNGKMSPEITTANFTYLRLHGPVKSYKGSYSMETLKKLEKQFNHWRTEGISTYCYFDNDEKGYAIKDAHELQQMCLLNNS